MMEMKNPGKLFFLFVILFSFSQCRKEKSDILYDRSYIDEIKAARENIRFYMASNYIPGGTFAIAKEGKIIYSEGIGLASKDLETPVNRNTKFRIGQLSSLLTNLMFHRMQKEGILHADSSLQFYYPEFAGKNYKLQLHHLVQQTSGIRNPTVNELDWRGLNVTLQKGIENFANDSLTARPGWYQSPNLFNYNLLGAVMEKETEKEFSVLLKEYVTDTLDLENTMVDNPFITIKGRTDFYDHNFIAQAINATFRDMRYRAPSEGLLSNAEDLVKFGNAMLFNEYFREVTDGNYFEPIPLFNDIPSSMTNEWVLLTDRQGRIIYGKTGSVTGGSASILVYPEEELVLACAVNLTSISDRFPLFDMAQHFLTQENQEPEITD
ncbi:MAG TPA: serine hydrolase domain-containing protein [Tangfeifania sp.]|nr:serine hydrolase domain-containing protein [Tangfeifania sp.]